KEIHAWAVKISLIIVPTHTPVGKKSALGCSRIDADKWVLHGATKRTTHDISTNYVAMRFQVSSSGTEVKVPLVNIELRNVLSELDASIVVVEDRVARGRPARVKVRSSRDSKTDAGPGVAFDIRVPTDSADPKAAAGLAWLRGWGATYKRR